MSYTVDLERAWGLAITIVHEHTSNAQNQDNLAHENLIPLISIEKEATHIAERRFTLIDSMLFLSLNKDGYFGGSLADGLGAAIFLELALREFIIFGSVKEFEYGIQDCLIEKILPPPTGTPVLDLAIIKLLKRVDVKQKKHLRSIEWMRRFAGKKTVFGKFKEVDKKCIQQAVNKDLIYETEYRKMGVIHSKRYALSPAALDEQIRIISVIRNFALEGAEPSNIHDLAVILLFYAMDIFHLSVALRECVRVDLVFNTKEELKKGRKNLDSRIKRNAVEDHM